MAKIKLYQRSPAPQYVGVPQMDNSGSIIANAVASSANLLADQANQTAANDQYMARWMLNQASQDLGQAIRQQRAIDAKQDEYNDFTSAQDAVTNFTMDMKEYEDQERENNPNAPENWASNIRQIGADKAKQYLDSLSPGARKLAMGQINNVVEARHAALIDAGRQARTDINDLKAQETAARIRSNAKISGAKQDFESLELDLAAFDEAAKGRLVKTPKEQVDKETWANKIAYLKDFVEEYSTANAGRLDDILQSKSQQVQGVLSRMSGEEIERFRKIDAANVNDAMTELSIADLKTESLWKRQDYRDISPVYTQLQDKVAVDGCIAKIAKKQNEVNTLLEEMNAKPDGTYSNAQYDMVMKRLKWLDDQAKDLTKISQTLDKGDDSYAKRFEIRNEHNSKQAQAFRRKLEQLETQINRDNVKPSERQGQIDAYNEVQRMKEWADKNNPSWLYEPTLDEKTGRILPGDTSSMDTRLGKMDEHIRRLQTKKQRDTPAAKIQSFVESQLEALGLKDPKAQSVVTAPSVAKAALPVEQHTQFDNAVMKAVTQRAALRKQNGADTSKEQAAADKVFYEQYYTNNPQLLPKPAPETKVLTGGVSKNNEAKPNKNKKGGGKTVLVPPPPADDARGGLSVTWKMMLKTIPREIIQQYLAELTEED